MTMAKALSWNARVLYLKDWEATAARAATESQGKL